MTLMRCRAYPHADKKMYICVALLRSDSRRRRKARLCWRGGDVGLRDQCPAETLSIFN